MTQTKRSESGRTSRRDSAALALLGAMFIALAMVGSASLGAIGPTGFQDFVNALGFGRSSAIETEQRRQAAVLETMGHAIHAISADIGAVRSRVRLAENHDVTVSDRFALVDADIAALVAEVRSLRTAQAHDEAAAEPWREPLASAQLDVLALRSSLDGRDETFRNDLGIMTKRLDRLEQMVSRDVTASIRPQVRRKYVQRRPRPAIPARIRAETTRASLESASAPRMSPAPFAGGYRPEMDPDGKPY